MFMHWFCSQRSMHSDPSVLSQWSGLLGRQAILYACKEIGTTGAVDRWA
jgi:hypothetical protein